MAGDTQRPSFREDEINSHRPGAPLLISPLRARDWEKWRRNNGIDLWENVYANILHTFLHSHLSICPYLPFSISLYNESEGPGPKFPVRSYSAFVKVFRPLDFFYIFFNVTALF